jgi:hypothetical protein
MPAAIEVRPGRWKDIRVLFDNGWYSAISVTYTHADGHVTRCIGVRWNGGPDNPAGFPSSRRYPQWHVEPDILEGATVPCLFELR